MLRSLATCVSAEMFISFSWAMSMVARLLGDLRQRIFLLIGGFFSLCGILVNGFTDPVQDCVLSKTRYRRESNDLLCF